MLKLLLKSQGTINKVILKEANSVFCGKISKHLDKCYFAVTPSSGKSTKRRLSHAPWNLHTRQTPMLTNQMLQQTANVLCAPITDVQRQSG